MRFSVFLVITLFVFLFFLGKDSIMASATSVMQEQQEQIQSENENIQGLLPEDVDSDSELFHKRYPLANYRLDAAREREGLLKETANVVENQANASLFALTNVFWELSVSISKIGAYLLTEAYEFDLVSGAVSGLATNLQLLLGVHRGGFSGSGFFAELLIFTILFMGVYVVVEGIVRRQTSKVLKVLVNYLVVFAISVSFVLGAEGYISTVNEFSKSISTSFLNVGTNLVSMGTGESGIQTADNPVDSMKEMLFHIQIRNPWLLLQFGNADASEIGQERIRAVESHNRLTGESYENRREAIQEEMENGNRTILLENTGSRFVSVFIIGVANFVITIFVSFLATLLFLSELLFFIFTLCLPALFLIGLIPGRHMILYKGLGKVFSFFCVKVGVSIILTVAFSISMLAYVYTKDKPLILVMFVQILCFLGVGKSLWSIATSVGMGSAAKDVAKVEQKAMHTIREQRMKFDNGKRKVEGLVARAGAASATGGASETTGAGAAITQSAEMQNNRKKERVLRKAEKEKKQVDEAFSRDVNVSDIGKREQTKQYSQRGQHQRNNQHQQGNQNPQGNQSHQRNTSQQRNQNYQVNQNQQGKTPVPQGALEKEHQELRKKREMISYNEQSKRMSQSMQEKPKKQDRQVIAQNDTKRSTFTRINTHKDATSKENIGADVIKQEVGSNTRENLQREDNRTSRETGRYYKREGKGDV